MRDGAWKVQQERTGKAPELYDLERDPAETTNLATRLSEIVRRLESAFHAWRKDVSADCPCDLDDIIARLKQPGIIERGR